MILVFVCYFISFYVLIIFCNELEFIESLVCWIKGILVVFNVCFMFGSAFSLGVLNGCHLNRYDCSWIHGYTAMADFTKDKNSSGRRPIGYNR